MAREGRVVTGDAMSQDMLRVHIFVSNAGDDQGAGSREQPLRTLQRALRLARDLERDHENLIANVFVKSGPYWISAKLIPGVESIVVNQS